MESLLTDTLQAGNWTAIEANFNCKSCKNQTCGTLDKSSLDSAQNFDAFLYIIVVLCFYASSILLLMVKYIRREKAELSLDHYYLEFVERTRFQCPRFKNKMAIDRLSNTDPVKQSMSNKHGTSDVIKPIIEEV